MSDPLIAIGRRTALRSTRSSPGWEILATVLIEISPVWGPSDSPL